MTVAGTKSSQLRARIERLESLLRRTIAAAASSALSFAGPLVANQAAATALPVGTYTTARQVYTIAQEAIWQYIPGVPGTVGVPALNPDEVITAAGGVLARTAYSSPKWRVNVNDVYIDPANPAASNENTGFDPASPLKTGFELHRRWGWSDSKPIVGCNLTTSPDGFLNIHIQSDIVSPDSLPIKITIAHDVTMRVVGNTPTVIHAGTLTNAVTAMNPAAPLGGTRLTLRDNALASWAAAEVPNRRVRMLDGPAVGGTFQPQTDSLVAPGQVQCSACQTTNEPGFALVPTTVTPVVGNAYQIEALTVCNFGEIDLDEETNPSFGGFNTFFNINNLNLPNAGGQDWFPKTDQGVFINFYQCTIDRNVNVASKSNIIFIACYFGAVAFVALNPDGIQTLVSGGGMNAAILSGGPGSIGQIIINGNTSIESRIDSNFVADGAISAMTGTIRNAAFWNAKIIAGANAGGHGLLVGGGGSGSPFFGFRGDLIFHGTVWGNSTTASAVGLYVSSGCDGLGAPQNITGVAGDLKLADRTTAWFFDPATATYQPAAGPLALSWANITAAQPAGFGGDAHNPVNDCHFAPLETTA